MEKKFEGLELLRLGVPMPSGRIYLDNEANRKAIADFKERVDKGTAYVEFGMPQLDGLDDSNKPTRMASISHRQTCARITELRYEGGVLLGDFEATGAKAPDLLKMLDEAGEPPVFALRAFTKPNHTGMEHTLHHVVSFDFIGTQEPERKIEEIVPDSLAAVAAELPDGSGFMTGSMALPKDHWIYGDEEGSGQPPMPMRMGTVSPFRPVFEKAVREAARYAVRASTRCGTEESFDPDALVTNMLIGLFGYRTEDGLSGDALDAFEQHPRFFAGRITLPPEQVKDIALANGFTEKPQGDGKPDDLHPYVYEFANAMSMASMQQFIGELGTAAFLADVEPPKPAAKLDITE